MFIGYEGRGIKFESVCVSVLIFLLFYPRLRQELLLDEL